MAEPTKVQEPAEEEIEIETQPHPTVLADQQAAAALSRLDQQHSADDDASSGHADKEALGKAMKGLDTVGEPGTGVADEAAAPAKKVKLDPKEVAFIVEWCYVGKKQAEQMLREAEGDGDRAMWEWVTGKKSNT